jgi:uridine kinase
MSGRVEVSLSTWRQPAPKILSPKRIMVLRDIAARVEAMGSRRVRVAVDGRTAAGKTTLGHELATLLADTGRVVLRASLDDFKRPWAEGHLYDRVSGEGYYRNALLSVACWLSPRTWMALGSSPCAASTPSHR